MAIFNFQSHFSNLQLFLIELYDCKFANGMIHNMTVSQSGVCIDRQPQLWEESRRDQSGRGINELRLSINLRFDKVLGIFHVICCLFLNFQDQTASCIKLLLIFFHKDMIVEEFLLYRKGSKIYLNKYQFSQSSISLEHFRSL